MRLSDQDQVGGLVNCRYRLLVKNVRINCPLADNNRILPHSLVKQ